MKRWAYVMPQTTIYTLVGECPILAGSPPVSTNPIVIPPTEDDEDTDLVSENLIKRCCLFKCKNKQIYQLMKF